MTEGQLATLPVSVPEIRDCMAQWEREMLDLLRALVEAESPTDNPASQEPVRQLPGVGLLLQQTWGKREVVDLSQPVPVPTGETEVGAHPLIINPFINFQLGKGWYIGTNDLQAQYSWEFGGWQVPVGLRFGYVLVQPKASWNFYVEYASDLATDDYPGAAAKDKVRVNVSYAMPVG